MKKITTRQLLDKVIELAESEPDFVYTDQPERRGSACSYIGAYIAHGSEDYEGRGCIIGQALTALGVPEEKIIPFDGRDALQIINEVVRDHFESVNDEELYTLQEIQDLQDTGTPWIDCVNIAMSLQQTHQGKVA